MNADKAAPSIGFSESISFSTNSDLYLQSDAPLIDKVNITVTADAVVRAETLRKLTAAAETVGSRIRSRLPRSSEKRSASDLFHRPLNAGFSQVGYFVDTNGMRHIREKWEPDTVPRPPRAFDSNTNLFRDTVLYRRAKEGLREQIEWLEKLIAAGVALLNEVYAIAGLSTPGLTCRFQHLEFSYHVVCDRGIQSVLGELIQRLRLCQNGVRLNEKGAVVEIGGGVDISIYQKSDELIRLELRLRRKALKDYAIKSPIPPQVEPHLMRFLNQWGHHVNGLLAEPLLIPVPLAFGDALTELLRHSSKHTLASVMSRLMNGDGMITVSSSDGPIYTAVRRLRSHAVLQKVPYSRSRYELTPNFRMITLTASHAASFFDSRFSGIES